MPLPERLVCLVVTLLSGFVWISVEALSIRQTGPSNPATTRATLLRKIVAGGLVGAVSSSLPSFATAEEKRVGISNSDLKDVILKDVVDSQFLATGQLTRNVYDESATFSDEIDTYTLDKWIVGTQRLFNGKNSEVRLVGDVNVSQEQVDFLFDEDLQFNIPFKPTVRLSGKLVLTRDPSTGLITKYQEFWDQDVATVLRSAKF